MFSNQDFLEKYDPETHTLKVGGKAFQYYLPKSIDRFIDSEDPLKGFPLWAKVWPSSIVLADYLVSEPPEGKGKTLEIGAGIGIVSIAASSFGYDMVISESDDDALEFARANALINGIVDIPIISMNWNAPGTAGLYDRIIGSEVVFRKEDIVPLKKLFQKILKPGGEAVLASEIRKPLIDFLTMMDSIYDIKAQQKVLRSGTEETKIILCRMKAP